MYAIPAHHPLSTFSTSLSSSFFVAHYLHPFNLFSLPKFFKNTYVEKLSGERNPKKKEFEFLVPGFINGWEMFHFHHVCTHGGADGIFVGLEGIDNENTWIEMAKVNKRIVTPAEWQKYAKPRGLIPLTFQR